MWFSSALSSFPGLNFQGDAAFYRGDFNSARTLYGQAFQAASRTKERDKVLTSKIGLAKIAVSEGHSREAISSLKRLAQEADSLGLKYLSVECSIYLAEALADTKDYSQARKELDQTLAKSERLGLRMQTARVHDLLGTALRLSGNAPQAAPHYATALRLLAEIQKEPGADQISGRSDVHATYIDSVHWAQTLKP